MFVDVNGDGAVDVPSIGFINAAAPVDANRSLYLRVVGRSGWWNQQGAVVCIAAAAPSGVTTPASNRTTLGCHVVDGWSVGLYDVHVGLPVGVPAIDVTVAFSSGHVHSPSSAVACAGLTATSAPYVLRDVPSVARVDVSPGHGLLAVGDTVTVTLTTRWLEVGLVPDSQHCCFINGVNVAGSIMDVGDGTYRLSYTVADGDSDVTARAPTVSFALADVIAADSVAVSDVVSSLGHDGYANFSIDAHPPSVTLTCSHWNATVRPTNNETLCLSCGTVTDETAFGCSVLYRFNYTGAVLVAPSTSPTTAVLHTAFHHGDAVTLQLWAVDGAGNVGDTTTLVWVIDSIVPVTLWPSFVDTVFDSADSTPTFILGCNRHDCTYAYSVDKAPFVSVSASSNSAASSSSAAQAVDVVDTVVTSTMPLTTSSTTAEFNVTAVVSGAVAAVLDGGDVTLQAKLDGDAVWTTLRLAGSGTGSRYALTGAVNGTAGLRVTGLSDGVHVLDVRTVSAAAGPDTTPWTVRWTVTRAAPSVVFPVAPPAYSDTPSSTTQFVVKPVVVSTMAPQLATVWYRLAIGNATSSVNVTDWQIVAGRAVSLDGLTPGTQYVLQARAVDDAGNGGRVATAMWATAACASPSTVVVDGVDVVPVSYGSVVVTWTAVAATVASSTDGYEYALDGSGSWTRVGASFVSLSSIATGQWHSIAIRAASSPACTAQSYPATNASWFEFAPPPGVATLPSTPPNVTDTAYGTFAVAATSLLQRTVVQYSLDNGSWSGCGTALGVGPLGAGPHSLRVRSLSGLNCGRSGGGTVDCTAGDVVTYNWHVTALSNATIALHGLDDSNHTLTVVASDPVGHVEAAPRTYNWIVDTVPPVSTVALRYPVVSTLPTNVTIAQVTATCGGEQFPQLCTFCWQVTVDNSTVSTNCSTSTGTPWNATIVVPYDGVVDVAVTAVDVAGNRGGAAAVQWTVDTTPPITTAAVTSRTVFVPQLNASVVNTSTIELAVGANEGVAGFVVGISRRDGSGAYVVTYAVGGDSHSVLGASSVVRAALTLNGYLTVTVAAVDLAGNIDPSPVVLQLMSVSAPPQVAFITNPPALTNAFAIDFGVSSPNEIPGLLSDFVVAVRAINDTTDDGQGFVQQFDVTRTGAATLQQAVTLWGLASGVYDVAVTATDVLGVTGPENVSRMTVDLDPPSSWFLTPLPPFSNRSRVTVRVEAADVLSTVVAYVRHNSDNWTLCTAAGGDANTFVQSFSG